MPAPSPQSPMLDAPADLAGPQPGSDRTFGFFFAVLFGALGAYAAWAGLAWAPWCLGVAALLALAAAFAPAALRPANRLWFALGMLLARIVNPLVIGAMFFLVITPMGLLMRLFGQRPLRLRFDRDLPTYWIERAPRGPAPESMRDQF